jgi:uncharacterized protein YjdB
LIPYETMHSRSGTQQFVDLVSNVGEDPRFGVKWRRRNRKFAQETHMFNRFCVGALLLVGLAASLTGCGSSPGLTSIVVSPNAFTATLAPPGIPQGYNQYTAIGYYTHPGHPPVTKDITAEVTWHSSAPQVAAIASSGLATATGFTASGAWTGITNITASSPGFNGDIVSNSVTFTVTACDSCGTTSTEPVISLAVTPASDSLSAPGQTAQFVALATTGSGLVVDMTKKVGWSSTNAGVATIGVNTGLATAVGPGTTPINALYTNPDGSVVAASASLSVSGTVSEPLASLAIVPASETLTAANQTAGLIAIGTTSSGTTVNLTGVSATVGSATIKAATWASSVLSVATINAATGVATAVANGTTAITAVAVNPDGTVVTATATITVTIAAAPEPLLSLSILPNSQSVASAGQSAQFLAIGTFSSTSSTPGTQNMANVPGYTVTWYSSVPSVATITSTGNVTSVGQGATAITAIATNNSDKSASLATATFAVLGPSTQEITSLTMIPSSQTITMPLVTPAAPTANFVVIGTNGTTGLQLNETTKVAWTSSDTAVATVDSTGGVTPLSQGSTTITAQYTNPLTGSTPENVVTATATLTVNGVATEPLLSIAILPNSQSVEFAGQTSQLIAIGTFSSAPVTQNLTTSAAYPLTWSSSNTAVATVTQGGLVTAVDQGTVAITAIAMNPDKSVVTGVASFTVVNGVAEQVTTLSIIPGSLSLSATGQPGQFIALGTSGTSGLQIDVTHSPQLAWSSSIPSYATIATYPSPNAGQASGVSQGTTNITAEWTNPATSTTPQNVVTAQSSVSVTATAAAEPLLSISVIPSGITDLDLLGNGQFLAYGTFSTAPTVLEITNGFSHVGFPASCTSTAIPSPCPWQPTTWVSTAQEIFPVDSAGAPGATGGLATAYGSGGTDIYAVAANPDSTLVYSPISTFSCPYAAPTYGTITTTLANGTTVTTTDFNDLLNPGTCNTLTIADALLSTLTVYNTGLNQTNWLVTAPSATGTPDVIHCGGTTEQATAGGSVCTTTYPNGTPVIITAPAEPGVHFGGWASSCTPCTLNGNVCTPIANPPYYSQAGPNYCSVQVGGGCTLNPNTGTYTCSHDSNVSVGAIFN